MAEPAGKQGRLFGDEIGEKMDKLKVLRNKRKKLTDEISDVKDDLLLILKNNKLSTFTVKHADEESEEVFVTEVVKTRKHKPAKGPKKEKKTGKKGTGPKPHK